MGAKTTAWSVIAEAAGGLGPLFWNLEDMREGRVDQFFSSRVFWQSTCCFRLLSSSMPSNFGDHEQKPNDPSGNEQRQDAEKNVGRNPHPNFGEVQALRPDWRPEESWHFTKTVDPDWRLGRGANDNGESLKKKHIEINPYEEGRPAVFNYRLLISAIIPRPIGFISTRSEDGMTPESQSLAFWIHVL